MPRPNGLCPDCGEPVLAAITEAGRRQLLNPEPDQRGNTAVRRDSTGTYRARVPNEELPIWPWERIHMPHPATCDRRLARPAPTPLVQPSIADPAKIRGWNGQVVLSMTDYRRRRKNRKR